jgi:hypothetical protein
MLKDLQWGKVSKPAHFAVQIQQDRNFSVEKMDCRANIWPSFETDWFSAADVAEAPIWI